MPEYAVAAGGRTYVVRITGAGPALQVSLDGRSSSLRLEPAAGRTYFLVTFDDIRRPAVIRRSGGEVIVTLDDEQYRLRVGPAVPIGRRAAAGPSGMGEVKAPIPGLIVSVEIAEGDVIEQGRPVVVMEAMKMQSELRAPLAGTVTAVHVKPGQEVMGGTVLVTVTPREKEQGIRDRGLRDRKDGKARRTDVIAAADDTSLG
jgi:biotin carboxyl carrier protein